MRPAVSLTEAVLAGDHPSSPSPSCSTSTGHLGGCSNQRVPLGGVPPLQGGLVVWGDVRGDIHASGEAVSG